MKGEKVKNLNDSNWCTFFIDSYYDKKLDTYYILTGNLGYVKSYNYNMNKAYHIYNDNDNKYHNSIVINDKGRIVKLIDSSCNGEVKIWDFHFGKLLEKILVSNDWLKGISLFNNDYLFVSCKDKTIKLIDLKSAKIIQTVYGHSNYVISVKIIFHPNYGKCLISQGAYDDGIKLWKIKSQ